MTRCLAATLLALAVATVPAWAGPPMVCYPFEPEGAPMPRIVDLFGDQAPVGADRVLAVLRALDQETDTLVRMAILQRMAVSRERALLAERLRYDAKSATADRAAVRSFDQAFFAECCRYAGGDDSGPPAVALTEAVRGLPEDAAAWLGLARAVTPLMRTGTLAEHAEAFLRAWESAEAMPACASRGRLRAVLARDLTTLESYLLDRDLEARGIERTPALRLDTLRRARDRERLVVHECGTFTSMQGADGVGSSEELWAIARQVDASLLRTVQRHEPRLGPTEAERYLFYRGLGTFALPVRVECAGEQTTFTNGSEHRLPAVFAVEMAAETGRFAGLGEMAAGETSAYSLAAQPLRPKAEAVAGLQEAVLGALTAQGLYADEAQAMVRTWSRQWFDSEGTRVLWLVPRPLTDSILPLRIDPAPEALIRVLLGRLEYLAPQAEEELESALRDRKSGNEAARRAADSRLARLDRFLEAGLRRILAKKVSPEVRASAEELLASLK